MANSRQPLVVLLFTFIIDAVRFLIKVICGTVWAIPHFYFYLTHFLVCSSVFDRGRSFFYVLLAIPRFIVGNGAAIGLLYLLNLIFWFVFEHADPDRYPILVTLCTIVLICGSAIHGSRIWSRSKTLKSVFAFDAQEYFWRVLYSYVDLLCLVGFVLVTCGLVRLSSCWKRLVRSRTSAISILWQEVPRTFVDLLCIVPLFFIIITVWRLPHWMQTRRLRFAGVPYRSRRKLLLEEAVGALFDIPYYLFALPVLITVYRVPSFYHEFVQRPLDPSGQFAYEINRRRQVCLSAFGSLVVDMPFLVCALLVLLTGYRFPHLYRYCFVYRPRSKPASDRRGAAWLNAYCIALDLLSLAAYITLVPFVYPIRSIHKRISFLHIAPSDCRTERVSGYRRRQKIHYIVLMQFLEFLFDLPYILCAIVAHLAVWRIPFIYCGYLRIQRLHPVGEAQLSICRSLLRQLAMMQLLCAVLDILTALLLVPVLLTLYRFPTCWTKIASAVRAQLRTHPDFDFDTSAGFSFNKFRILNGQNARDEQGQIIVTTCTFPTYSLCWKQYFQLVIDIPFIILGLTTMLFCVWRIPSFVQELSSKTKEDNWCAHDIRGIVVYQALKGALDVPCIAMFSCMLITVYRARITYQQIKCSSSDDLFSVHLIVTNQFINFLIDVPYLLLTLILCLSMWRTFTFFPMASRVYNQVHCKDRHLRRVVRISFYQLILDVPTFVVSLLILLTMYRFPSLYSRLPSLDKKRLVQDILNDKPTMAPYKIHLLAFTTSVKLLIDIPFILIGLVPFCSVWRTCIFLSDFKAIWSLVKTSKEEKRCEEKKVSTKKSRRESHRMMTTSTMVHYQSGECLTRTYCYRYLCVEHFSKTLADIPVMLGGLLLLVTAYRLPLTISNIICLRSHTKARQTVAPGKKDWFMFHRLIIASCGSILLDLPFILAGLINIASGVRTIPFLVHMHSLQRGRGTPARLLRSVCIYHLIKAVISIPIFICTTPIMILGYRLPSTIRQLHAAHTFDLLKPMQINQSFGMLEALSWESEKIVISQLFKCIIETPFIVLGIIVICVPWRAPLYLTHLLAARKNQTVGYSTIPLALTWKHFQLLLLDIPGAASVIIVLATMWRAPVLMYELQSRWRKRNDSMTKQTHAGFSLVAFSAGTGLWQVAAIKHALIVLTYESPFVVALPCTFWRLPLLWRSISNQRMATDERASTRRINCLMQLFLVPVDIIALVVGALIFVSLWRAKSLWNILKQEYQINGWSCLNSPKVHKSVITEFVRLVGDLPYAILYTIASCTLWRKSVLTEQLNLLVVSGRDSYLQRIKIVGLHCAFTIADVFALIAFLPVCISWRRSRALRILRYHHSKGNIPAVYKTVFCQFFKLMMDLVLLSLSPILLWRLPSFLFAFRRNISSPHAKKAFKGFLPRLRLFSVHFRFLLLDLLALLHCGLIVIFSPWRTHHLITDLYQYFRDPSYHIHLLTVSDLVKMMNSGANVHEQASLSTTTGNASLEQDDVNAPEGKYDKQEDVKDDNHLGLRNNNLGLRNRKNKKKKKRRINNGIFTKGTVVDDTTSVSLTWSCPKCTYNNFLKLKECSMCRCPCPESASSLPRVDDGSRYKEWTLPFSWHAVVSERLSSTLRAMPLDWFSLLLGLVCIYRLPYAFKYLSRRAMPSLSYLQKSIWAPNLSYKLDRAKLAVLLKGEKGQSLTPSEETKTSTQEVETKGVSPKTERKECNSPTLEDICMAQLQLVKYLKPTPVDLASLDQVSRRDRKLKGHCGRSIVDLLALLRLLFITITIWRAPQSYYDITQAFRTVRRSSPMVCLGNSRASEFRRRFLKISLERFQQVFHDIIAVIQIYIILATLFRVIRFTQYCLQMLRQLRTRFRDIRHAFTARSSRVNRGNQSALESLPDAVIQYNLLPFLGYQELTRAAVWSARFTKAAESDHLWDALLEQGVSTVLYGSDGKVSRGGKLRLHGRAQPLQDDEQYYMEITHIHDKVKIQRLMGVRVSFQSTKDMFRDGAERLLSKYRRRLSFSELHWKMGLRKMIHFNAAHVFNHFYHFLLLPLKLLGVLCLPLHIYCLEARLDMDKQPLRRALCFPVQSFRWWGRCNELGALSLQTLVEWPIREVHRLFMFLHFLLISLFTLAGPLWMRATAGVQWLNNAIASLALPMILSYNIVLFFIPDLIRMYLKQQGVENVHNAWIIGICRWVWGIVTWLLPACIPSFISSPVSDLVTFTSGSVTVWLSQQHIYCSVTSWLFVWGQWGLDLAYPLFKWLFTGSPLQTIASYVGTALVNSNSYYFAHMVAGFPHWLVGIPNFVHTVAAYLLPIFHAILIPIGCWNWLLGQFILYVSDNFIIDIICWLLSWIHASYFVSQCAWTFLQIWALLETWGYLGPRMIITDIFFVYLLPFRTFRLMVRLIYRIVIRIIGKILALYGNSLHLLARMCKRLGLVGDLALIPISFIWSGWPVIYVYYYKPLTLFIIKMINSQRFVAELLNIDQSLIQAVDSMKPFGWEIYVPTCMVVAWLVLRCRRILVRAWQE